MRGPLPLWTICILTEEATDVKELIIVIGMMLLGCYVFNLMVGDEPNSLKSTSAYVIKRAVEEYGG